MKYCFLMMTLCVFLSTSHAQDLNNNSSVKGSISNSMTGKAVPFASVSLYKNNKHIKGMLADSIGRFEIQNLTAGIYYIRFSMMGYQALQTKPLALNNQDTVLDFGTIWVVPEQINLKTVTIRGRKPLIEQRADGITFNVESLPSIAGSDAADVLRNVPMVAVDPNGGLSIRGSSNVRVLIDSKPSEAYASSPADALKMIRGENIVKVEVITHPSAKYDAEGTDAVVNVITRKIKTNITNGNVGGDLGNRSKSLMGDIHSKNGKWIFNADAFYQHYQNRNGSMLQRETESLHLVQKNETKQSGHYFFGGANIFYSLDSLNTFNIGYRMRPSDEATTGTSSNYEVENGILTPSFQSNTRTPNNNKGNTFNVGYTGASKNGHSEFSLLGIYLLPKSTTGYNLARLHNEIIDYRENFSNSSSNHDFIIQGDYSKSFDDRWKWETGIKIAEKKLQSESRFDVYNFQNDNYVKDTSRSNGFSYKSSIYAVYNNLSLKLKKWGLTAGARYERTKLNAVFKDGPLGVPSFDNLVPQILINRIINEESSLKLGYTMKIVRPYISYLNPTVNKSDSLTLNFGNPYLKPEITNSYQLSYTVNAPQLFKDISIFFNDNRNTIENIRTPLPGGVFESTWKNTGQNQRLGLSATINWKPTSAFNLGATFTGQYVWLKSPALSITNKGFMRELVLNGTYKLPKGYSVYFYGFFDARNLSLQGYREGWKYYSMTISKKSENERFNLSLKMDAFLTPYSYIDEEITTGSFHQLQIFRYQNQNFRLSFSYRLGKSEIKSPRIREFDNAD
ncbi:TonB-dependent receptor [Mucilaginibacter sp.]|uniref:TonB-dependent receptor domain-containing protein n=1 Tax=Mucilaginibacter sp. TaxID=1882438 RepID=UPI0026370ABC|nr:TonB-dependent receptor [Mucilaginibacter sp.]MDB4919025.1 TonB-dependent receptor [Mucilaginibacter sp.]